MIIYSLFLLIYLQSEGTTSTDIGVDYSCWAGGGLAHMNTCPAVVLPQPVNKFSFYNGHLHMQKQAFVNVTHWPAKDPRPPPP